MIYTQSKKQKGDFLSVGPPSNIMGDPFSFHCQNPSVTGFILSADCFNFEGNSITSSTYFKYCLSNVEGNLSTYTFGTAGSTLPYTNCTIVETSLACKCQKADGQDDADCSIELDSAFTSNDGKILC